MNPLDIPGEAARLMSSAQAIHQGAQYFARQVAPASSKHIPDPGFTFKGPSIVKADKTGKTTYVYYGNAPPGVVEVYSDKDLEASTSPLQGKYYANLFFSKPTTPDEYYDVYAVIHGPHGREESDHIHVTALQCPNCNK